MGYGIQDVGDGIWVMEYRDLGCGLQNIENKLFTSQIWGLGYGIWDMRYGDMGYRDMGYGDMGL